MRCLALAAVGVTRLPVALLALMLGCENVSDDRAAPDEPRSAADPSAPAADVTARGGATSLPVTAALAAADTAGFARATEPRDFTFPVDHGPHDAYRTEWWYVTGNVATDAGREFGFQFTIFRHALAPAAMESSSAWATNQVYMGHFALTDVEGETFEAFERFERPALELAGANADPLRVWIGDWALESPGRADPFPMRVSASDGESAIDLTLSAGKPVVLHGEGGLSQKSPDPGNASYYYSHTRMSTEGTIVVRGDTLRVSGLSWLDREWSTSALAQDQAGWDWFALQLDNGWELMAYQMRTRDGAAHPSSYVVVIDPAGEKMALNWSQDFSLEPVDTWESPVDGAVYPSGWRVRVLPLGWELVVEPQVRDQELNLTVRYWEGAVRIDGSGQDGEAIGGRGYVELTGYGD